jgi:hypothetical protein
LVETREEEGSSMDWALLESIPFLWSMDYFGDGILGGQRESEQWSGVE